jgi:small subunit ribosomal protein S4
MHPTLRRKMSDFKKRLVEKQKLRFSYWLNETQFRNYVKEASKKPGVAGETLLSLLERRLDTVVYRLGFAPTLLASRQLVTHGHVRVNDRRVSIPSYLVKERDEISLLEPSKKMALVEEGLAKSRARPMPSYIALDKDNLKGALTSIPTRDQIPLDINEALIMEHYTKYL